MPGKLRSMTAFAGVAFQVEGESYLFEIRSVNSRFLDVRITLPEPSLALEHELHQLVTARIFRGRVEISVRKNCVGPQRDEATRQLTSALEDLHGALAPVHSKLGLDAPLSLSDLLEAYRAAREAPASIADTQAFRSACLQAAEEAVEKLIEMRTKEGQAMDRSLAEAIEAATVLIESIDGLARAVQDLVSQKLQERIEFLLKGQEVDPARLAQEVALLADKADVTEEVVRTRSHIEQLRKARHDPPPHGRKLEFLLQEIHREANTIAAKSPDVRISRAAVELKAEVEKMRELVRNVE